MPPMHPDSFQRRQLLGLGLGLGTLLSGCAPLPSQNLGEPQQARFAYGVASGQPQPDRLVLWTMLTGAGLPPQVEVQWELAADEGFASVVAQGSEWAEAAWSHSVHAEPAGLEPGRWYWYRFTALGQRSGVGRTRTAPAADATAPLHFVTASCQRWDHGHWAAWRHVVQEAPDLVVFLGDYIYESAPVAGRVRLHNLLPSGQSCRTLADYRARHALYKTDPALQAAHAIAPWVMIWDDHEVENDYAGLQGQQLQPDFPAQRAAAYRAYWEFLPFPKALRPTNEFMRITARFDWGRLARLICVDGRQYRDPQACPKAGHGGSSVVRPIDCAALDDPRRSLLGMAQEQWLAESWSRQHRWNLLAQTTLMARTVGGDRIDPEKGQVWTDGWNGYAPARQRLLQTVQDRRVPGCVVLSGDVHATYAAELKADPLAAGSPRVATEFCGTSISSHGWDQARTDALLEMYPLLRYGRSDERGFLSFRLEAHLLRAEVRSVIDPNDPASGIRTAARFAVEPSRPIVQRI
ncbi:MAG TPA: alkaline phosphatase D family protein [Burkholderiaceae bacterium]|nr:alkaline phosphatase D family protein [Burkholderiaceae bacterium]HMY99988.1 alkaline phosphatase D family protein [Burkholderiaceae bacterium]